MSDPESASPPDSGGAAVDDASLEIHGTLAGITVDLKLNSPKGGRPLLKLLDDLLNALGPPPKKE